MGDVWPAQRTLMSHMERKGRQGLETVERTMVLLPAVAAKVAASWSVWVRHGEARMGRA